MTNLEKACDDLWRRIIKLRDGHKCRVPKCNKAGSSAHHVIRRGYANTRYDIHNGVTLCIFHHCHPKPGQLLANVRECITYEEYDRLYDLAQIYKTWRSEDLKELRTSLKEILNYYKTEYKDSNKGA